MSKGTLAERLVAAVAAVKPGALAEGVSLRVDSAFPLRVILIDTGAPASRAWLGHVEAMGGGGKPFVVHVTGAKTTRSSDAKAAIKSLLDRATYNSPATWQAIIDLENEAARWRRLGNILTREESGAMKEFLEAAAAGLSTTGTKAFAAGILAKMDWR